MKQKIPSAGNPGKGDLSHRLLNCVHVKMDYNLAEQLF